MSAHSRPVRVLHLISGLVLGGGQQVVMDLRAEQDRALDVISELCVLGSPGGPFAPEHAHIVKYGGAYDDPRVVLHAARALRRYLRRERPDVLHSHGWDAHIIGSLARTRLCRQVVHLHITAGWLGSTALRHRVRRAVTAWPMLREGAMAIAVSAAVRDLWQRHLPSWLGEIHIVRNGIDLSKFSGSVDPSANQSVATVRIAAAGRLASMKGFEHLVDSTSILKQRGIQVQVRVAGAGPLQGDLEQRTASANLGDSMQFLGRLQDMAPFYAEADAFVLPSVSTEGLPLVVLEAMASGLPIIATRVAGTPEVVRDGVEGLLVPPGDPAALADAIERLVRDTDFRCRLGANGVERVRVGFSRGRMAAEVQAAYSRLLSPRRKARGRS